MRLSIIIVNWNTRFLLKQCLRSIYQARGSPYYEVVVVDNASTDGSAEMIKTDFAQVVLLANDQNIGFGKANNQAAQVAKGEYLLFLNSDTIVPTGSIEQLVDFALNFQDAGIIGPKLVNTDGSAQPSVRNLPTLWQAVEQYWFLKEGSYDFYIPSTSEPVSVESVTGAVMLISKKLFRQVGMFDSRYFLYFEDLDLCRKILKAGFKIYYLPQVTIVHHLGQSGKPLGDKTYRLLVESSKIYHGWLVAHLISIVIRIGTLWRKIFGQSIPQ